MGRSRIKKNSKTREGGRSGWRVAVGGTSPVACKATRRMYPSVFARIQGLRYA
jgi:hypothetical protein